MRIALLTYSTKPRGGVVHTLALAEALVDLGAAVDVWTLARDGDTAFFRAVDPRVGIRAVHFPPDDTEDVGARIVRSIAVLRSAFETARSSYDVVHAQDCISANASLPCVRTIHHLDQFTTPELAACHERAVVEPIARICVSAAVAAEVDQGWGLSPTVIPNGVAAERFAAGAADDIGRARWRERIGGRYVLALGGIEPRKGSIDLLEAHALLLDSEPDLADVQLVFGGGETLFDYRDYRTAFEQRAGELGNAPVILGPVPDDELPSLVGEAAALGFVSTKEGFGLAAMEALAAGVPVVARDLPVLREVFGDAVSYAADPSGIAAALADALLRPPAPAVGRRVAGTYTWRAAAQAHLRFYRGLTAHGAVTG
jgi:glycosyltransferase-like protein